MPITDGGRDCWQDPKPDDTVYVRYEVRVLVVTKLSVVYTTDTAEVRAVSRADWAEKGAMSGNRIVSRGDA